MVASRDRAAFHPNFLAAMGTFYNAWSTAEITIEFAIGKFLDLPHDETHLMTASMEFNRKANFARVLITRSGDPKQGDLIKALNTIQNESLRNVFAHSFLRSTPTEIIFVERTTHGKYSAREHTFTVQAFKNHVRKLTEAASDFYIALGDVGEEFKTFCLAATSVRTSANTSPTPPKAKA